MGTRPVPKAFTLVEVIVATVLVSVFLGLLMYVFRYAGRSQKITEKLDAFHYARTLNFRISSELKFSSGILFPVPPTETGKTAKAHQVIFRDAYNRVKAIILDPQHRLLLLDYERFVKDKLAPPTLLSWNVESFEVSVNSQRVCEFKAVLKVNQETHEVLNQVLPTNQF